VRPETPTQTPTSPEQKPSTTARGLVEGAVELSMAGGATVAKVECSKPVNEVETYRVLVEVGL